MRVTFSTNTQTTYRFLISVLIAICNIVPVSAAVGIIDLDIDEQASTVFEFYYYDGRCLTKTDYAGFQDELYPLCTGSNPTYLITDTLSLMSQHDAGLSFKFNGQGLQSLRLELLDLDNNVVWHFFDDNLYSGTSATTGKVPYKTVQASDISITTDGPLPDLCRLRLSAVAGKDSYRLHLHALNMYSDPLPWNKCRIELASPAVSDGQNLYLTWITLNGASSYNVVTDRDDTEPAVIQVPAEPHATHHAVLPLTGIKNMDYRIEARMGNNIVTSQTWQYTAPAGSDDTRSAISSVTSIPGGLSATSAADGSVEIYSIAGIRLLDQMTKQGDRIEIRLPSGIYIVRFPDTTMKAVVGH
ncbi:MAG: T9SS type A sorting domain-containing protein [Muribaculaceae bacterium]|nr:T9SS type A sorting domain-containing protein [Muribaculaceae bacterium]